jgi:hypothetical protein
VNRSSALTSDFTAPTQRLREAERKAREALEQGCADDLMRVALLFGGPLRHAGAKLETWLLGLGSSDSIFERTILMEQVIDVQRDCMARVFANANVRFRARFGIYASALAEAEHEFLRTSSELADAHFGESRRIALPHIKTPDDWPRTPESEISSASDVDEWTERLGQAIFSCLAREVNRARAALLRRGRASLARTQLAPYLAIRASAPG